MPQLTQLQILFAREPLRRAFFFLLSMVVGMALIKPLFWMSFAYFGQLEAPLVAALSRDYETIFQAVLLLASCFVVARHSPQSSRFSFLKSEFFPVATFKRARYFNLFLDGAFRGFLALSLCVAVGVLMGVVAIEGDPWLRSLSFVDLPNAGLQLFAGLCWVVLLEKGRSWLWQGFVAGSGNRIFGRVLLICFESVLWFEILFDSSTGFTFFLGWLLSCLCATTLLFWYEQGQASAEAWRADLVRTSFVAGFFGTLFHVYGVQMGDFRRNSWLFLIDGPLLEHWTRKLNVQIPVLALVLWGFCLLVFIQVQRFLDTRLGEAR